MSQGGQADFHNDSSNGCGWHAKAARFGGAGATDHYPPSLELEPIHIDIELAIDIPAELAQGCVTQTVIANRSGARRLSLDAVGFLDIRVKDAAGQTLTWSYDGRKLDIVWEKPLAQGEKRAVQVSYRVERPVSGLFFMQPTAEEPTRALYAATDHETERARYWLPCIDLPNVRTTLAFRLTAAEKLQILANGRLIKEELRGDGTKTAHWQLDQRCPSYLVCFTIGDFSRCDDGEFEGLPLAYFSGRDFTAEDLRHTFGRTRPMLEWMTKRLGVAFPYPKYFQFALPAFGGAMENISLVSWSDTYVCDEAHLPERTWICDQVNVHEMAHSYFGDLVVCRDFAHAWLKESWATYIESCWLEDSKGEDEQFYDLYSNAKAYFHEADENYARPLVTRRFTSSWQMYDRHLYPGGACRLHTLRWELGDACFWPAVTDYLSTYREQVVETDDLRRMLEKHSGRSLQKLFDQWVHSPQYPDIKVTFTYDQEKQRGTFEVEQKQARSKAEAGRGEAEPAATVFELTTELGWTIDGQEHLREIRLTHSRHVFEVPMAKDPEQVRFDPRWRALHKLEFDPGETRLKRQLKEAKQVTGRIHAAKVLCESGKRASIQLVVDAYQGEPFWGVRCEMLKFIAETLAETAVQGFVRFIADEKDPMVQRSVFVHAGRLRDERITVAVRERLGRGDLYPGARAAALGALGCQRGEASLDVLSEEAGRFEAPFGESQAQALAALGMSRSADVAPQLFAAAERGRTSFRTRGGALTGLGHLAPYVERGLKRRIEETLADYLRDPDEWVRASAAAALRAAGARSAVGALAAYRRGLPLQEQVRVDAILEELSKDENSQAAGLEKQLAKLLVEHRQLSERVQDLEDRLQGR